MEKLKGKYEIILGFITLVVSLSAFKDELSQIKLNLGYTTFSLSNYFLLSILGFSLCLYLYIIENVVRDTVIGKYKIFDYFIMFAYLLFVFILCTPILLFLNVLAVILYEYISNHNSEDDKANIFFYITATISFINIVFSFYESRKILKNQKKQQVEIINRKEIIELENAEKLFIDGYYSQSLFETFKVLQSYLYKKLLQKDLRVSENRFPELLELSLKYNLIEETDKQNIEKLRNLRNVAAHKSIQYSKEDAEFARGFVKQIINREN